MVLEISVKDLVASLLLVFRTRAANQGKVKLVELTAQFMNEKPKNGGKDQNPEILLMETAQSLFLGLISLYFPTMFCIETILTTWPRLLSNL